MALRVLLADESSTIKRVMQLALQDFAVEVKAVPVGLDVVPVTKTFKPDIIFADVLLTKRNGYEICQDLKKDPETKLIPVVLMWSGFMDIDEIKIAVADARLEKPFDADTLRQLVQSLVPKTQTNPVSPFLKFPKMPEFSESLGKIPEAAPVNFDKFDPSDEQDDIYKIPEDSLSVSIAPSIPLIETPEDLSAENLLVDSEEEFTSVPLKSSQQKDQHEDDGWSQQDLKKFKIQIPSEKSEEDFAAKFMIPQENLGPAKIQDDGEFEELDFGEELTSTKVDLKSPPTERFQTKATHTTPQKPLLSGATTTSNTDPEMIERVIREEVREVIENICWKMLPEIAEKLVREEIQKILRDVEKSV